VFVGTVVSVADECLTELYKEIHCIGRRTMARLTLDIPSELGTDTPVVTDGGTRKRTDDNTVNHATDHADDPQILEWVECWANNEETDS
jgi:hypothetical protein